MRPDVSVIIPTLQVSDRLVPLVKMYCEHPAVGEIIIVNNSVVPLPIEHAKVRVLQQDRNIYVNPAWNLGALQARFPKLLISNDDILVSPRAVTVITRLLRLPIGVVGMHVSNLNRTSEGFSWIVPALERTRGFGTLMGLSRTNYVPIPESLKVWYGDDWLVGQQTRLNIALRGIQVLTRGGETASRPEIKPVLASDTSTFNALFRGTLPYEKSYRWLRRPVDVARRVRGWLANNRSSAVGVRRLGTVSSRKDARSE